MGNRIKWNRTEIFEIVFDKTNSTIFAKRAGLTKTTPGVNDRYDHKLTEGKRRTIIPNQGVIKKGSCLCSVKEGFKDRIFGKECVPNDKLIIETNILTKIEHVKNNMFKGTTITGAIIKICVLPSHARIKEFDKDGKEIKVKVITKIITK